MIKSIKKKNSITFRISKFLLICNFFHFKLSHMSLKLTVMLFLSFFFSKLNPRRYCLFLEFIVTNLTLFSIINQCFKNQRITSNVRVNWLIIKSLAKQSKQLYFVVIYQLWIKFILQELFFLYWILLDVIYIKLFRFKQFKICIWIFHLSKVFWIL